MLNVARKRLSPPVSVTELNSSGTTPANSASIPDLSIFDENGWARGRWKTCNCIAEKNDKPALLRLSKQLINRLKASSVLSKRLCQSQACHITFTAVFSVEFPQTPERSKELGRGNENADLRTNRIDSVVNSLVCGI